MALQPYALTTVAAVVGFVPQFSSNPNVELVVNGVSSEIQRYLSRWFGWYDCTATGAQERYAGEGTDKLLLRRWPIVPGTVSVTIDGTALTDFWTSTDPDVEAHNYLKRWCGWPAVRGRYNDLTLDSIPDWKLENIVVGYQAGYILPGYDGVTDPVNNPQGLACNLPPELQLAAIRATIINITRPQIANLTAERTPGGADQSYARPNQDKGFSLPPEVLEQIERYRGGGW